MGLRSARAKAQLLRAVVRPSGGPAGFKSEKQAAITRVASSMFLMQITIRIGAMTTIDVGSGGGLGEIGAAKGNIWRNDLKNEQACRPDPIRPATLSREQCAADSERFAITAAHFS